MTDTSLISRWQKIKTELAAGVQLIAVSKYTGDDNVATLLQAGQLDFGEARPQNLRDRANLFPQARWHMIGPLQKNKAKYVGRYAYMWHSLCDLETAQAVAEHVSERVLPVLVQVNISAEKQKQGIAPDELPLFLEKLNLIKELKVIGLMGMAARDADPQPAFSLLRNCRDDSLARYPELKELCMGMSNDWRIAIHEGATMIRVGSEIFGEYTR